MVSLPKEERTCVEVRLSQTPAQNRPRGYREIAEKARRIKEKQTSKPKADKDLSKSSQPSQSKGTTKSSVGEKRLRGDDDPSLV